MNTTDAGQSKDFRDVHVYSRFVGLSDVQLNEVICLLRDIPHECRERKNHKDYVLCIELICPDVCSRLRDIISMVPALRSIHGIFVSMVTDSDSDGTSLPGFVIDYLQNVGGYLDFSFTVV